MESTEKSAFAARAYIDYGTGYESEYLRSIIEKHPNADLIKLPNLDELHLDNKDIRWGKGLYEKEKQYFFPLIDKCDIFFMAPVNNEFNKDGSKRRDKGLLTEGVKIEVLYALAIGKKVYTYKMSKTGDYIFQEIRGIFDSEELIKSVYLWDKYFYAIIDDRIKELLKTEKRLPQNIHPKITGLYERNKNVMDIMKGFLSSNRSDIACVKPIVLHKRYPAPRKDPKYGGDVPIRYLPYGSKRHFSLKDLSIDEIKRYKGEMHFYEIFFDDKVLDDKLIQKEIDIIIAKLKEKGREKSFRPYMVFNVHVIGAGIVFDIDAPSAAEIKYGKVDMFDDLWYEEFMAIKIASEELAQSKWLKCVTSTTGNGFNITCEPYWFDERQDTFANFKNTMETGIRNINVENEDKIKGVHIDEKILDWSIYKKMPFTYHAKWNRITLPVAKGRIDKEWLKKMSNIDYFLSNEIDNLNEVIEKSNWNIDKWW